MFKWLKGIVKRAGEKAFPMYSFSSEEVTCTTTADPKETCPLYLEMKSQVESMRSQAEQMRNAMQQQYMNAIRGVLNSHLQSPNFMMPKAPPWPVFTERGEGTICLNALPRKDRILRAIRSWLDKGGDPDDPRISRILAKFGTFPDAPMSYEWTLQEYMGKALINTAGLTTLGRAKTFINTCPSLE